MGRVFAFTSLLFFCFIGTVAWAISASRLDHASVSAAIQLRVPDGSASAAFNLDPDFPEGDIKWRYQIPAGANGTLQILGDLVVYEEFGGKRLIALNFDGSLAWENEGQSLKDLLATDQVGDLSHLLYGYNRDLLRSTERFVFIYDWEDSQGELTGVHAVLVFNHSGNELFKFYTDHPGAQSVRQLADGTTIYFSGDTLYALDMDGKPGWEIQLSKIHYAEPLIAKDQTIYLQGVFDSELHAVSPDGRLKWSITTDRGGGDWPVGARFKPSLSPLGNICVVQSNGVVYSISPEGKHLWQRVTGDISAPPGIAENGTIFLPDEYDGLIALGPDGTVLWVARNLKDVNCMPVAGLGDVVYVISGNEVYAVANKTGKGSEKLVADPMLAKFGAEDSDRVKWAYKTNQSAYGMYDAEYSDWRQTPLVATDGTVYISSPSLGIVALSPDGVLKWSFGEGDTYWGWGSKPFVIDSQGRVYSIDTEYVYTDAGEVVAGDSYIFALDADGNDLWKTTFEENDLLGKLYSSATMILLNRGNSIERYPAGGGVDWKLQIPGVDFLFGICATSDGKVYCTDSTKLTAVSPDGTISWEYRTESYSRPVIGPDNSVYILSIGALTSISSTGEKLWEFNWDAGWLGSTIPPSGGEFPAVAADGTAYIGTSGGKVIAVSSNGELIWDYQTNHVVAVPAIGKDGTIYVTSFKEAVHALNSDGTLKWKEDRLGFVNTAPAIGTDGTVYVGNDLMLFALSP